MKTLEQATKEIASELKMDTQQYKDDVLNGKIKVSDSMDEMFDKLQKEYPEQWFYMMTGIDTSKFATIKDIGDSVTFNTSNHATSSCEDFTIENIKKLSNIYSTRYDTILSSPNMNNETKEFLNSNGIFPSTNNYIKDHIIMFNEEDMKLKPIYHVPKVTL